MMAVSFSWCARYATAVHRAFSDWTWVYLTSEQRRRQEQITQVATTLSPEIGIWQVEASLQLKAAIAQAARKEVYRGFLLCCDAYEHTFLLDTHHGCYVAVSHTCLLQIDGLAQARRFVDALDQVQPA